MFVCGNTMKYHLYTEIHSHNSSSNGYAHGEFWPLRGQGFLHATPIFRGDVYPAILQQKSNEF